MKITICGGGNLGQVIAGFLSARHGATVNVLTRNPERWSSTIQIATPENEILAGKLNIVSDDASETVPGSDIVLLCLPGFAIKDELWKIKPYITERNFVGSVFSSTGFFFEAMKVFGKDIPLWGFQRVPFIARTETYGQKANLLGYKKNLAIAVENTVEKEKFRNLIETLFERPTVLLNNYYEASFSNSNPILHPARLYSLFRDWKTGTYYDHNILFYGEWNDEASDNLIKMDAELFKVLEKLPVSPDYLTPILEYYESTDTQNLTKKIRSIESLHNITSPMSETANGWVPDFGSRYFTEDFPFGLHYIHAKALELGVDIPKINEIYTWGMSKI